MNPPLHPEQRRNFGRILPAVPARGADQAAALRAAGRAARVLAITSGKGGVGKSNIAVNLAIALAQLGRRVTLVDLDLGLANTDVLLDLTPRHNLAAVICGRRRLEEIVLPTPYGFRLVAGASGVEKLANLLDEDRGALARSLEALCAGADFVLFDTAAGISKNTTEFLAAADETLVVTAPEPTAVVDAYAVIKLLAAHEDRGDVGLIVNMASGPQEAERFAHGICTTAYRMLNLYVERRGHVVADPHVPAAVRARRPFVWAYSSAPASACIRAIARRLCSEAAEPSSPTRPGFLRRAWHTLVRR